MRTAIRKALGTVLGALLGYVVMAFGGPMVQQLALFGQREAPEARRYMIGVLQSEPALAEAAMTAPAPAPAPGPLRPPLDPR